DAVGLVLQLEMLETGVGAAVDLADAVGQEVHLVDAQLQLVGFHAVGQLDTQRLETAQRRLLGPVAGAGAPLVTVACHSLPPSLAVGTCCGVDRRLAASRSG